MKDSMAMRVGRIISGGLHQLLDVMENVMPDAVMEQAIREVDSVIDEVRADLGKVIANKHLASKRLMNVGAKHEELAAKIDVALQENREDLAEAAIAQQLDFEAQMPILEGTVKECSEKERELEGFLIALQAKKREMQEELHEFRQSRAAAASSFAVSAASPAPAKTSLDARVAKAESAFDHIQERHTNMPGGRSELKTASQLVELENLARRNRIQERLAVAKAKLSSD